jgi:hypothetical protein
MGTRTAVVVALSALAACASAGSPDQGQPGQPDAGVGLHPVNDARQDPPVDAPQTAPVVDAPMSAPPIDAPPSGSGPHTLVETTNPTDGSNSIACGDGTTYTDQNSYYRIFTLSDFGITTEFHVASVDLVVEDVEGGASTLTVKVGTYSGTTGGTSLTKADIATLTTATKSAAIGDTSESIPITADIPAGGNVAVEIDVPSGKTGGKQFYIGANAGGESAPGYISSTNSACNATAPTSVSTAAGAETDILITVSGTAD